MKRSFAKFAYVPLLIGTQLISTNAAFAQSHRPYSWSAKGHATVTIRNGFAIEAGVMLAGGRAVADGPLLKPRLRHMDDEGRIISRPSQGGHMVAIVDLP